MEQLRDWAGDLASGIAAAIGLLKFIEVVFPTHLDRVIEYLYVIWNWLESYIKKHQEKLFDDSPEFTESVVGVHIAQVAILAALSVLFAASITYTKLGGRGLEAIQPSNPRNLIPLAELVAGFVVMGLINGIIILPSFLPWVIKKDDTLITFIRLMVLPSTVGCLAVVFTREGFSLDFLSVRDQSLVATLLRFALGCYVALAVPCYGLVLFGYAIIALAPVLFLLEMLENPLRHILESPKGPVAFIVAILGAIGYFLKFVV